MAKRENERVTRFTSVQRFDGDAASFACQLDEALVALQREGATIRRLDPHRESGPAGAVQTAYIAYYEPADPIDGEA